MGLLDDAIREHLDLKRRRGADPTEIERAEQEALGPVRRGPDAPPAGAGDEAHFAYDHEDEDEWEEDLDERAPAAPPRSDEEYDPFEDDEEEYEPLPHGAEEDHDPEPPARAPARFADEDPFEDEEPFADEPPTQVSRRPAEPDASESDSPRPHPADRPRSESAGGETVEYDSLSEGEGEDVLEETPEFLQDTPDHDRLWFEQKPPRDFDFND
jgi:hypothetical protein